MSFSRRTLSLATIVLILAALSLGVWWRLGGPDASSGDGADTTPETAEGELPEVAGTEQFSTSVPQPVTGAEVVLDTLCIQVNAAG